MPNLYCRNTALPNIVGRIDYISSEHRQERLLASYDGAADLLGGHYWEHLASECQAAYEQANKKTRTVIDKKTGEPKVIELKCCQGRELMFTLCNSLLKRMPAEEIAEIIAKTMEKEIGEPCAVSIHLKHFAAAEDNLHAHVVFGERHLLEEPVIKIAERNLFFDAEGKRHYKKSEILDDDGELLPGCSIIKKGEVYEQRLFGNADEKYAHRSWTKEVKTNVVLPLLNKELKGDIEIKEYDPSTGEIPYMHETKGLPEEQLADVRAFNALNKDFREKLHAGIIPLETALQIQAKVFASNTKTATLQAEMDAWREAEARKGLEKEAQEAAEVVTPALADGVDRQEEKQKLRELYKERADLRSQIADMEPGMYRDLKKGELEHLNKRIEEQREEALGIKDLRMAQKIGRELGFTRKEVDLIYDALPFFSEEEWARLWKNAAEGIKRYREKLEELARAQADYLVHLAEWRRYEKYRWVLDPRNHRSKSILGMLVAIVALSFMRSRGEILSDKEYAWAVKRGLIDDIRGKRRIDPVEEERLRLLGLKIQKAVDEIRAFREWEKNGRQGPRPGTEPLEEMDFVDAARQIDLKWQEWERLHPEFMEMVAEMKQTAPDLEELAATKEPAKQPAPDGYTDLADLIAAAERRKVQEGPKKENQERPGANDDYGDFDSL